MKTIFGHIEEIRNRLIFLVLCFFLAFVFFFTISDSFIILFISRLPQTVVLITSSPLEIFFTKLSISLFLSLFLCLPLLLLQFASFIEPGLRKEEKKYLRTIPLIVFTFYIGFAICAAATLSLGIPFAANYNIKLGIKNFWSVSDTITLIFVFSSILGVCFELPLLILFLSNLNLLTREQLTKHRKAAYVIIFIISAVITPTVDPITQLIVALPLIILFELSVLLLGFT
ncbi:twin-arginine translocase subunit TatC [Candidatus Woesearchaeota archaeon]|nr:twin-arginine translocase subunit TatC [Candidatus Woesearchaeota archaeon]